MAGTAELCRLFLNMGCCYGQRFRGRVLCLSSAAALQYLCLLCIPLNQAMPLIMSLTYIILGSSPSPQAGPRILRVPDLNTSGRTSTQWAKRLLKFTVLLQVDQYVTNGR